MIDSFKILVVDGYNILHAWPELKEVMNENLERAREKLIAILTELAETHDKKVIVVFDGGKVGHWVERIPNPHVKVIFAAKPVTADTEIERFVYNQKNKREIMVATSDRAQQLMVAHMGTQFLNAIKFKELIDDSQKALTKEIKRYEKSRRPSLGDNWE
jgi:ribosomal protection tetracycline resistance protein